MVKKNQEKQSEFTLLFVFVFVFNVIMVVLTTMDYINVATAIGLILFWTFILGFNQLFKIVDK